MALEIPIIILLIIFNGVLAMSELAIVSARKTRLQHRTERGDTGARIALELANNPNQFLSTAQIGITLVGILAGVFGGATIAEKLAVNLGRLPPLAAYNKPVSIVIVVLSITYLSLVFGELVPKRLALNNAEEIATWLARPMRGLSVIATPAAHLLSVSTEAVLRVLRVQPPAGPPVTEEEIRSVIKQGTEAGDCFDYGGFRFDVVDIDGRRVDKILVRPSTTEGEGQGQEGGNNRSTATGNGRGSYAP